jgi:hypothetical protein
MPDDLHLGRPRLTAEPRACGFVRIDGEAQIGPQANEFRDELPDVRLQASELTFEEDIVERGVTDRQAGPRLAQACVAI